MEFAGVAELKARLSEYLSKVKAGEEVLVTERGRPVARLVPIGAAGDLSVGDGERARLLALEREGLIQLGSGKIPEGFFDKERPLDEEGLFRSAVEEEREEGW